MIQKALATLRHHCATFTVFISDILSLYLLKFQGLSALNSPEGWVMQGSITNINKQNERQNGNIQDKEPRASCSSLYIRRCIYLCAELA
jgi:hypothetical protein